MFGLIPLFLSLIFGLSVSFVITKELKDFERLGLSFLIGIGLQTWFMFIFYLIHFNLTLSSFLLQWAMLFALSLLILRIEKRTDYFFAFVIRLFNKRKLYEIFKRYKPLICIIGFISLVSMIIGLYWPVIGWDALALYDFRAKTFLVTGGMQDGISRGFFFGYPLLTSLGHTWVYMFHGNPHLIYWSFYLSFIVVTYNYFRSKSSSLVSGFGVLILAVTPPLFQQSFFDYSDLPYLIYTILGFLYIDKWLTSSKNEFLIIALLLGGLSTWSRITEPFWIVLVIFSLLGLILRFRGKWFSVNNVKTFFTWLASTVLFFTIQLSWRIYQTVQQHLSNNYLIQVNTIASEANKFNINKFIEIIVSTYVVTISSWQPVFTIFLLFLILEYKKIGKYKNLFGMFLVSLILLIGGTYEYSLYIKDWMSILPSQKGLSGFMQILLIIMVVVAAEDSIDKFLRIMNIKNAD